MSEDIKRNHEKMLEIMAVINKSYALKRSARKSFNFRGHVALGEWETTELRGKITAVLTCKVCGKGVYIDTNPAPNGIDIGGEAVALGCTD